MFSITWLEYYGFPALRSETWGCVYTRYDLENMLIYYLTSQGKMILNVCPAFFSTIKGSCVLNLMPFTFLRVKACHYTVLSLTDRGCDVWTRAVITCDTCFLNPRHGIKVSVHSSQNKRVSPVSSVEYLESPALKMIYVLIFFSHLPADVVKLW